MRVGNFPSSYLVNTLYYFMLQLDQLVSDLIDTFPKARIGVMNILPRDTYHPEGMSRISCFNSVMMERVTRQRYTTWIPLFRDLITPNGEPIVSSRRGKASLNPPRYRTNESRRNTLPKRHVNQTFPPLNEPYHEWNFGDERDVSITGIFLFKV